MTHHLEVSFYYLSLEEAEQSRIKMILLHEADLCLIYDNIQMGHYDTPSLWDQAYIASISEA